MPSTEKKPAQIEGEQQSRCYCGHLAAEHTGACRQCGCRCFQPRPCRCGHSRDLHRPGCRDATCQCRRFQEDQTPEFLLRRGVRAGEWQFITASQLASLMQPHHEMITRVWACGILHTVGQRSRIAMLQHGGCKRLLRPMDIVSQLRHVEDPPNTDRHKVRRALARLEELGMARRLGQEDDELAQIGAPLHKNRVGIAFYFKPPKRCSNSTGSCREVAESKPLLDTLYERICGQVVKGFRRAVRTLLEAEGLRFDPQETGSYIEEAASRIAEGVKSECQKLLEGVKNGACFRNGAAPEAGRPADNQAKVTPEHPPAALLEHIQAQIPPELIQKLGQAPTPVLLNRIGRHLAGAPPEMFGQRIRLRFAAITSLGMLVHLAGDVSRAWQQLHSRGDVSSSAQDAATWLHLEAEQRAILNDPAATDEDKAFARKLLGNGEQKVKGVGA